MTGPPRMVTRRAGVLVTAMGALLMLAPLGASQTPAPQDAPVVAREPFPQFLDALRQDALAAGIRAETVQAALGGVELLPIVLERDRSQAEFTLTLPQYVARRLTPAMVRLAQRHARAQKTLLSRVARAHEVPASVLVAVWGLESNFGRFSGVRPTIQALTTLVYEGRRAALFKAELLDALRIIDRGDIELARLKGSWAGAMGQPQFLPSSYLKYAQDFDGDGRRDIWSSLPDVLASIGFYLKSRGWAPEQTWGRRVRLPEDFDEQLGTKATLRIDGCRAVRLLTTPLPLAEWRKLGVRTATGSVLPRASIDASLLRVDGETFLVYRNYETLLTYNCAHSYAMSVALLADRLDGRTGSWPAQPRQKPARAAKPRRR